MEVILTEKIEKLGQLGEEVTVKPGFARNFLLPQGKAVRATEANRKLFSEQKTQMEAKNLQKRTEAEKVRKKIEGLSIILIRQAGESGQLYGSVTKRDTAAAITNSGFSVDRSQIKLEKPIKTLGLHSLSVSLHPEVHISVICNVARSTEEAKAQEKSGKAVLSIAEEDAVTERQKREEKAEIAANEAALDQANNVFEEGVEIKFKSNPDEVKGDDSETEENNDGDSKNEGDGTVQPAS